MDTKSTMTLITIMYLFFNGARVLSYIPQIYTISKEHNKVTAISLLTWIFWTMANLTTAIYAQIEVRDTMLALINYGNALCCAIVVIMVLYKRNKYLYSVDTLIEIHTRTMSTQVPLGVSPKKNEYEKNEEINV